METTKKPAAKPAKKPAAQASKKPEKAAKKEAAPGEQIGKVQSGLNVKWRVTDIAVLSGGDTHGKGHG